MYNNELYHYGVKGMKWGVRKAAKAVYNSNVGKTYRADYEANRKKDRIREQYDADKRKARSDYRTAKTAAKANVKSAKREYNEAFDDAYKYRQLHPLSGFKNTKSGKELNRRMDIAVAKAETLRNTKADKKQLKQDYKQTKKDIRADANRKIMNAEAARDKVYNGMSSTEKIIYRSTNVAVSTAISKLDTAASNSKYANSYKKASTLSNAVVEDYGDIMMSKLDEWLRD